MQQANSFPQPLELRSSHEAKPSHARFAGRAKAMLASPSGSQIAVFTWRRTLPGRRARDPGRGSLEGLNN